MSNSMGIWLVALIVLSYLAISTAKGSKWRLTNLGIIVVAVAFGFGLGVAGGVWGKNMELGGMIAVPLATWLGIFIAIGCWRRNKMRDKAAAREDLRRTAKD
jgi:hypothetical protein